MNVAHLIPEPAYQQWGEHWWSGNQVAAMASREANLRSSIRAMTALLKEREWAEHVSDDPDVAALEAEITELVGRINAAATTKQEEGETLPGILCPNGGYCDYPSNPCFTCRRPDLPIRPAMGASDERH